MLVSHISVDSTIFAISLHMARTRVERAQMIEAKFKCLPIFDAIVVGQRTIKLFRQYTDELINWHVITASNLGKGNAHTLAVTPMGDLNKLIIELL